MSPLLCFTALIKLHLKGGRTRTSVDSGLVTAVIIVVRGLRVPSSQHHWLLGLMPAILIHLRGPGTKSMFERVFKNWPFIAHADFIYIWSYLIPSWQSHSSSNDQKKYTDHFNKCSHFTGHTTTNILYIFKTPAKYEQKWYMQQRRQHTPLKLFHILSHWNHNRPTLNSA